MTLGARVFPPSFLNRSPRMLMASGRPSCERPMAGRRFIEQKRMWRKNCEGPWTQELRMTAAIGPVASCQLDGRSQVSVRFLWTRTLDYDSLNFVNASCSSPYLCPLPVSKMPPSKSESYVQMQLPSTVYPPCAPCLILFDVYITLQCYLR